MWSSDRFPSSSARQFLETPTIVMNWRMAKSKSRMTLATTVRAQHQSMVCFPFVAGPNVVVPSYNTGATVYKTVAAARAQWDPVWVVVDGSTDGTAEVLQRMAQQDPGLTVTVLPQNQGKGAAVLTGLHAAAQAGFTHALTMDSDGQHPADLIGAFMQASIARPDCMVLGRPVFDASAPLLRVRGRKVSNWWANLETMGAGVRIRITADGDDAPGKLFQSPQRSGGLVLLSSLVCACCSSSGLTGLMRESVSLMMFMPGPPLFLLLQF